MGKVTNNFPKKTYFCLINLYAMKITIVSGARPNFMKIAPITRAIKAAQEAGKKISYRLIYTGRQDIPVWMLLVFRPGHEAAGRLSGSHRT